MNSVVDKIASRALDTAVPETWTTLSHEQLQKFQQEFARLLVNECAEYIANVHDDYFISEQLIEYFKG